MLVALLLALACISPKGDDSGVGADGDGDGFSAPEDCDDGDPAVNPGAAEACGGGDEDCDGVVDEADALGMGTWYADGDGDGFGDPANVALSCEAPSGRVGDASDCDDSRPDVSPIATESCDSLDDDCDGEVDESGAVDALTWYADSDGDSFGDVDLATPACEAPEGYVPDATDCDDSRADVSPVGTELCDSLDDDCDGEIDEAAAVDASTWFMDSDADGFGDALAPTPSCDQPEGFVADATDCDDADPFTNPGSPELCGGGDEDCDAAIDESTATDAATWYADADGDGYGDPASSAAACAQPGGFVANAGDCEDGDASIHPAASELCGGSDEDCDAQIDEATAVDAALWYADSDADGYGDATLSATACTQPSGFVSDDQDCDDLSASSHPGADETCGGGDEDCDGQVDEASAIDAVTWYADGDGDGYGWPQTTQIGCAQPTGMVAQAGDCDDLDASVNRGAAELCGGADEDCDGAIDEWGAVGAVSAYADADEDGYGDAANVVLACPGAANGSTNDEDCDDGDAAVNPGQAELCWNGVDDDCDPALADCEPSMVSLTADPAPFEAVIYGDNPSDGLGSDFAVGDFDLDGVDDLVVSSEVGVYVFTGPFSGERRAAAADQTYTFSASIGAIDQVLVGDFDGSGAPDLLLGADAATIQSSRNGAMLLFIDPGPGTYTENDATTVWAGPSGGGIPVAMAQVSDISGDGAEDIAVGTFDGTSTYRYRVDVVQGSDVGAQTVGNSSYGSILGDMGGSALGQQMDGDGDLDGDGVNDLVMGDWTYTNAQTQAQGAVWVVPGPMPSGTVNVSDVGYVLEGPPSLCYIRALSLTEDVDGDGYPEMLVGYEHSLNIHCTASFAVIGGPITADGAFSDGFAQVTPVSSQGYDLESITGTGDVDGDGHVDIVANAAYSPFREQGALFVYLDTPQGVLDGTGYASVILTSVNYPGAVFNGLDANADGIDDLLLGAVGEDYGQGLSRRGNVGAVFAFFGGVE